MCGERKREEEVAGPGDVPLHSMPSSSTSFIFITLAFSAPGAFLWWRERATVLSPSQIFCSNTRTLNNSNYL